MALIDVTFLRGESLATKQAGCINTDFVKWAVVTGRLGSETVYEIVMDSGEKLTAVGNPQAVLTP